VEPDGVVEDPLNPEDSGDNYGVIMLADVMLQTANREGDEPLAQSAESIIGAISTRESISAPFNILAIASILNDGRENKFAPQTWPQVSEEVKIKASDINPFGEQPCLSDPSCYDNWRLVGAAGASALLQSGLYADGSETAALTNQIKTDLKMAVKHAGPIVASNIAEGAARELSDPISEPSSYHIFSEVFLEHIISTNPALASASEKRLLKQAGQYALDMMAPDGQLSLSGRSLDQSWVEAAAVDLGYRMAQFEPAKAAEWRSFADRAYSYLISNYPIGTDGLISIVPGLGINADPKIMDNYAALNQYDGLTLYFLNDALGYLPSPDSPRAPIPVDKKDILVNDLHSSGLVWGHSGDIWWELDGRTTVRNDPRYGQGVVAVKLHTSKGWKDLLALRPINSDLSSNWKITLRDGQVATPTFQSVHGNSNHVILKGDYRLANGEIIAPAAWSLKTNQQGVKMSMSKPRGDSMRSTVWLSQQGSLSKAQSATAKPHRSIITASGNAIPITLSWGRGTNTAHVEIDG
jgi:hypothetical protein